jgi:hypothetical protein
LFRRTDFLKRRSGERITTPKVATCKQVKPIGGNTNTTEKEPKKYFSLFYV